MNVQHTSCPSEELLTGINTVRDLLKMNLKKIGSGRGGGLDSGIFNSKYLYEPDLRSRDI